MMALAIAQASAAAQSAAPSAAASDRGWLLDPELIGPGFGQTMASGSIQTSIPPPPPVPETPAWLLTIGRALARFFEWSAPAGKPLLWIAVVLLALVLLYHFVPAFARLVDALRRRRGDAPAPDPVGTAEAGAARALLAEADALAAAGRYAEAVHLLLFRSVEDIAGRRPGLVRPATTSRALAGARDLPGAARDAFGRIARAVEISLFGGRPIDAAAWEQCRTAYAELTVPRAWART